MASSLRQYLYWSIAGLLFIIPFLPLYISGSMLFPFITGRNFTFRIATEIAFVLWLGLITVVPEYRPKPSKLLGAVIAFVGIVFLADLFGVNPYRSFFSNYERMEGFLMIAHLGIYFTILTSIFQKKDDWKIFWHLFVAGSLIASVYALFQKLGILKSIQGGVRVDGTIGNPTYLAAYLLLSMAVISVLFWNAEKRWQKSIYGAFFLFEALIILFTASRGVVLASGIGLILWLLFFIFFAPSAQGYNVKKYKMAAGIVLVIAILTPVLFYLIRDAKFIRESPIFSRFAFISLQEKTTRSRFMIWSMAYQGFQERPLLGWGQENFPAIFSKYYNPKLFDQEPWFDRSHNIFFDWLVHTGILGLASYLTIFIFVGAALRQYLRSVRNNPSLWLGGMTLGVFLIAYFLQNVLVFDNLNTYILFFALLAYIETLRNSTAGVSETKTTSSLNAAQKGAIVLGLGFIILIPVSYTINIKPIRQSRALIEILRVNGESQPKPKAMEELFRNALAYNSFGATEIREQLSHLTESIMAREAPREEQEAFYRFAIAEAEKQREEISLDVKYRLLLSAMYQSGFALDQALVQKSEENLLKAIEMSPGKQPSYFMLAELYLNANQTDKAIAVMQKTVALAPNFLQAQLNLAVMAILSGGYDAIAKQAINEVVEIRKKERYYNYEEAARDALTIGNAYLRVSKFSEALEFYKRASELQPENAPYHAYLADIYTRMGDKQNAIKEAEEAARLNPEEYGAAAEAFIKQLSQ
ncbi:MAG: O-antigen ligase family protein [bacterium]|nr:O-antigen ligase family protein [bacterium]